MTNLPCFSWESLRAGFGFGSGNHYSWCTKLYDTLMKAIIPQELCLSFQLLYSVLPYLAGPLRPTGAPHLFPSHWAQYPICCVQTFIDWCHLALAWGYWAVFFTVPMRKIFKQGFGSRSRPLFVFSQQNVEQKSQIIKVKHPPNQMDVQGSKRSL